MSDPDWPSFTVSPKEHYHALGVFAAEFNVLEGRLLELFLLYLGFDDTMAFIFMKMRDNSLGRFRFSGDGGPLPGKPELPESLN